MQATLDFRKVDTAIRKLFVYQMVPSSMFSNGTSDFDSGLVEPMSGGDGWLRRNMFYTAKAAMG